MRRKLLWLVAIASLLGLAAWLFGLGEEPPPAQPQVAFPEHLRPEEQKRAVARRSLPPPKPQPQQPAARPRPRDPLLAALRPASSAIVLEANALRYSPAGELLLKCLAADDERAFDRMRDETGIDPLKDLDRIAIEPNGFVATGQFGEAKWSSMFSDPGQSYGDEGVIYPVGSGDAGAGMTAARWGDQLLAFGEAGSGQQLIDQMEGRGSSGTPPLDESQTYGDAYGVIGGDWLSGLLQSALAGSAPGTEARILQAANKVELHLDASSDLNLTATFNGPDPTAVDDLGRALGGALSLWRLSAETHGDSKLVSLLDQANIVPGSGSFRLELSVPLDFVKDQLKDCGKRHGAADGGR